MPKVLVTRTRTEAGHNTRVFRADDAIDMLADLRASTDGDIGVGGATLATALLRAGLLDELLLFTHPDCPACTALLPEIGGWQQERTANLTVALVSRGTARPVTVPVVAAG